LCAVELNSESIIITEKIKVIKNLDKSPKKDKVKETKNSLGENLNPCGSVFFLGEISL